MFSFNRYDGGAVVLHALRKTIGDDLFFTLMRRWVADNNGSSRTTEDFVALANEVSGRDLTEFFATWLYADVVPTTVPGLVADESLEDLAAPLLRLAGALLVAIGTDGSRSMALMPSHRSGSGSHCLERWLTHGSETRSVSRRRIRSARVRPARLVVVTPSPT